MSGQKNISLSEATYEELDAWKMDDESFSDAIDKLLESVDKDQTQFGATSVRSLADVTKTFEADEDGRLEIDIKDESGKPIGVIVLSELAGNQTVFADITSGERSK